MRTAILSLLLITAAGLLPASITISSVNATKVSHGSALINFHVTNDTPNGDGTLWTYARLCFSGTAGNCSSKPTNGYTIMPTSYPAGNGTDVIRRWNDFSFILTGLTPATSTEACVELSNDKVSWTLGACTTFTTQPLPAIHPVRAEKPRNVTVPVVPTDYSAFHSGFSAGDTVIGSGAYPVTACSSLQSDLQYAVSHQDQFGTLIALQAGAVCSGRFWESNNPPDVKSFGTSDVNLTTNKIHLAAHGLNEGHGVMFGKNDDIVNGDLPGEKNTTVDSCTGIKPGEVYYAHFPDGADVDNFQLTCEHPYPQGPVMAFADTGSAANSMWMAPYPRRKDQGGALYPIVIHTSTPESQLPPPGVRLDGPAYSSKLAQIQPDVRCGGVICHYDAVNQNIPVYALTFGNDYNSPTLNLAANLWGIGLEIQTIDATGDASADPVPTYELIQFKEGSSDNGLDRCYIHGRYPWPNRLAQGIAWDGHNNSITNSYFDRIVYPFNSSNNDSAFLTEGTQFFIINQGPGPYVFYNNHVEATGNTLFFQAAPDGAIDNPARYPTKHLADIYVARNYFTQNPPSQPTLYCNGQPGSDGFSYRNRQLVELKGGFRSWLDGNIFENDCHATASSVFATTSVTGGIDDVTLSNNTFKHVSSGVMMGSCTQGGPPVCAGPTSRYTYTNNLFYDINGFTHQDHFGIGGDGGWRGWIVQTAQDGEDFIWDHNTVVSNVGTNPSMFWLASGGAEGFQFTNSIFSARNDLNGSGYGARIEGGINIDEQSGCSGGVADSLYAESLLTCPWRFPGSKISGNLVTSDSLDSTTVATNWPSQKQPCLAGNTSCDPTNLDLIGWTARDYSAKVQNYQLRNDSRYISGGEAHASDGLDMGANIDALEKAQGKVYFTSAIPASTTATVNFVAPDAQGCPVDVSTSDPTLVNTFTRTTDAGGAAGPRSVTVSGLTAHSDYYFRINCAVEQPTGTFHTN